MNKLNMIICDTDEEYLQAFVTFLLEKHGNWLFVTSFTDVESYMLHQGTYDVGFLSEDFLGSKNQEISILHSLYLCEESVLSEYAEMTQVFKYQSMNQMVAILQDFHRILSAEEYSDRTNWKKGEVIGIYSPISHELQMPYALTLAKILSEKKRTLFIDLEDLSMLPEFINQPAGMNLYDIFYLIEGANSAKGLFLDYVISSDELDILPAFTNINQMSEIKENQWSVFLDRVLEEDYEVVVLLFGRVLPGFPKLLEQCSQILLLNKSGEYYQKCQWMAWEFLRQLQIQKKAMDVSLPMSAMNLTVGMYVLEELYQGNMGRFVRRQLEAGEIAMNG